MLANDNVWRALSATINSPRTARWRSTATAASLHAGANYNGGRFTYQVSDGQADSGATVNLTITSVNDVPVAADDNYTTPEDTTLTVNAPGVLANDSDADGDR